MPEKRVSLMISDKLHKDLKIHCARIGQSIKDFVELALWEKLTGDKDSCR